MNVCGKAQGARYLYGFSCDPRLSLLHVCRHMAAAADRVGAISLCFAFDI
jgi:hypothetical protein